MRKLIVIGVFTLMGGNLSAQLQPYNIVISAKGEVPLLDFSDRKKKVSDVVRYDNAYLNFASAVQLSRSGEIFLSYVRSDAKDGSRRIEMARSTDAGRSWTEIPFRSDWDGSSHRAISMFNMGKTVQRGNSERHLSLNNSLVLFSGGYPFEVSTSLTGGIQWTGFYPVNRFGGYRITGLVPLRDGKIMAVFHDDGRWLYPREDSLSMRKSAVYKIISEDGGLTWSYPDIAVKHNLASLYDGVVFRLSRRRLRNTLVMLASERSTHQAYIAFSTDEGKTWSYPEKLPPFIQGDRFGVSVWKNVLFVVFRDLCRYLNDGTINPSYGDLVMWTGDMRELIRGHKNGIKIRLADNYPAGEIDIDDLKFTDCGYPSLLITGKEEITVIAYGRWEPDSPTFLRSFTFNPMEVKRIVRDF